MRDPEWGENEVVECSTSIVRATSSGPRNELHTSAEEAVARDCCLRTKSANTPKMGPNLTAVADPIATHPSGVERQRPKP